MPLLESETFEFPCLNPDCRQPFSGRYGDAVDLRRTRCPDCGSEFTFDLSEASILRSALSDLERAEAKIARALGQIILKAQIKRPRLKRGTTAGPAPAARGEN